MPRISYAVQRTLWFLGALAITGGCLGLLIALLHGAPR